MGPPGILGAAFLPSQGLAPTVDVLDIISRIFTDTIGAWAGVAFLLFAAISLFDIF